MVRLKFDNDGFSRAVRNVPRTLGVAMRFRLSEHARDFERVMDDVFTARQSGPFRANTTRRKLVNRTGALRRSFRSKVTDGATGSGADTALRVTIGNARTAHYVFTQEKGGTIRPKTSKYLAIPMPANLTNAGRPRFERPRQVEGLFVLRRGNKLFLVRPKGEGLEFLWVLKKQVKVPPRLGFVDRWNSKKVADSRIRSVNAAIDDTLRKVKLR